MIVAVVSTTQPVIVCSLFVALCLSLYPSARPACQVFQLFLSRCFCSGVVVVVFVVVLFMSSLAPFYFNSITIHLFLFWFATIRFDSIHFGFGLAFCFDYFSCSSVLYFAFIALFCSPGLSLCLSFFWFHYFDDCSHFRIFFELLNSSSMCLSGCSRSSVRPSVIAGGCCLVFFGGGGGGVIGAITVTLVVAVAVAFGGTGAVLIILIRNIHSMENSKKKFIISPHLFFLSVVLHRSLAASTAGARSLLTIAW